MSSSRDLPVTPENKRSLSRLSLGSPALDTIDCSPETKSLLNSRKRKTTELLTEGSPKVTANFLNWRLAVVRSTISYNEVQKKALREGDSFFDTSSKSRAELLSEVEQEDRDLENEEKVLMSQRKTLEEDLKDIVTAKQEIEPAYFTEVRDAYINELRWSLYAASRANQKIPGEKVPRLERKPFRTTVEEYLGTRCNVKDEQLAWCNVMGLWFDPAQIKCAHIVPYSWNLKDTSHMFGSGEPALVSKRNGLSLLAKIEEAFDNCWIAFVPITIDPTPTQWKVVLLNTLVEDNTIFTQFRDSPNQKIWRWRDIHGRHLQFKNDNRPARRFLYMRYTLAWLHAEEKKWPDFKSRVPPGTVWATPNKPEGYLRKSILLELGKKTGDKLPQDLISAGAFEDPGTSSIVNDRVAAMTIAQNFQAHLGGVRDVPEEELEGTKED